MIGSKFWVLSVDQKHHYSGLTECVLTECVLSSNGVCMVVLNKCTIFGQHTNHSISLGTMQFGHNFCVAKQR